MPRFSQQELKRLKEIKGTKCCNCNYDAGNNIIFHHIIPIVVGGNNIDSNIVPLCSTCHYKLHNVCNNNGTFSHSELTKIGIEKAKLAGKQIGGIKGKKLTTKKSVVAKEQIKKYSSAFGGTLSDIEVIKLTGLARNTYYKYKKELKENSAAEPDMEEVQEIIENN